MDGIHEKLKKKSARTRGETESVNIVCVAINLEIQD